MTCDSNYRWVQEYEKKIWLFGEATLYTYFMIIFLIYNYISLTKPHFGFKHLNPNRIYNQNDNLNIIILIKYKPRRKKGQKNNKN